METLARLAELVGGEVAADGALVVPRDGQRVRIAARWRRGWQFVAPADGLAVRLRAQLGTPTLLGTDLEGATDVADPCWRLTASDPYRAARLLAEPPWPIAPPMHRGFGAALLDAAGDDAAFAVAGRPAPLFELEVGRWRATMTQRDAAATPSHVAGAVRRLVQLVTRPARLADEPPRRRRVAAPYR